ncbi:MAG: pilus assembly protein N-terminal domain-containing protein [Candidatus Margulisiibacteriota bacterium]|jgi:Flp pilus assembly secretin CpaC
MKRSRYILVVLFLLLNSLFLSGLPANAADSPNDTALFLNLIRDGVMTLGPDSPIDNPQAIQKIQEMLLSLKNDEGGPLYDTTLITLGTADARTFEMIKNFQKQFMDFSDNNPYIGSFGAQTLQALNDKLLEQNKPRALPAVAVSVQTVESKVKEVKEPVKEAVKELPKEAKNTLVIPVGASKSIILPYAITNVAVGNPNVGDPVVISSKELLVNGKAAGNTSLTIWTAYGKENYNIVVIKKSDESDVRVFYLKNIRLEYNEEGEGTSVVIRQDVNMANELAKILSSIVAPEDFSINTRLNLITVAAPPAVIAKVEKILTQLDQPREQIVIEAKIYEVKNSNDLDLKMQAQAQKGQFRSIFDNTSGGLVGWVNSGAAASVLAFQMNALVKEGKAKVLAKPRILAQDGRGSSILVGTRIPLVNVDKQGNVTVQYIDTGTMLAITPRLVGKDQVDTWFRSEVSNITGYAASGYPEISTRKATTQARVKLDDTLVIGGLLKTNYSVDYLKVPFLGDVPFLGELFRSRLETREDSEIVITLTPKLI